MDAETERQAPSVGDLDEEVVPSVSLWKRVSLLSSVFTSDVFFPEWSKCVAPGSQGGAHRSGPGVAGQGCGGGLSHKGKLISHIQRVSVEFVLLAGGFLAACVCKAISKAILSYS